MSGGEVGQDGGSSGSECEYESESPGADRKSSWSKRLRHVVNLHGNGNGSADCGWYLLKWIVPGLSFFLSFVIQNYFLYIATYFYVQWMYRLEHSIGKPTETTYTGDTLSSQIAQGSLHDITAAALGYHDIPTSAIDGISLSIPVCWLVLVVYRLNLHLFTKCCLCGTLLALGKGTLSVLTIVPDSIGWTACKARLGPSGLAWFQDSQNVNFQERPWRSLIDLFHLEVFGVSTTAGKEHNVAYRRVRFCADMLYSGHTYFASLFALGLYDCIWMSTQRLGRQTRCWVRFVVGCLLTCAVIADATVMLMNQFHYTIDVVMALMVVFLYYTNAAIARVVVWWADEVWVPRGKRLRLKRSTHGGWYGEVLIPPCFLPFCLIAGRYNISNNSEEVCLHKAILMHATHMAHTNPERFIVMLREIAEYHRSRETEAVELRLDPEELQTLENLANELEEGLDLLQKSGNPDMEDLLENTNVIYNGSPLICGKLQELISRIFCDIWSQ